MTSAVCAVTRRERGPNSDDPHGGDDFLANKELGGRGRFSDRRDLQRKKRGTRRKKIRERGGREGIFFFPFSELERKKGKEAGEGFLVF
ncbi:hypothetical protein BT93_I0298 [Corymbia citriodora subsp. variegata]|nr:hypothetical protein BT93_I0298 [Corymbia citriodora subsp. variegata]